MVTRRIPPRLGITKGEQTSRVHELSKKPEHQRTQKMISKGIEIVIKGLYPVRMEQGIMNRYCSTEMQREGKPDGRVLGLDFQKGLDSSSEGL